MNNTRVITKDSIFEGLLTVYQYKNGYRFSLDAPLLANFVLENKENSYIEFGSGSGIISMILSFLGVETEIYGVEIQKDLYDLSLTNIEKNGIKNLNIIYDDLNNLKKHLTGSSFDIVFSNPPYRKSTTGKISGHSEKAIAKHELKVTMLNIIKVANYILKPYGKLKLIYPVVRLTELIETLNRNSFGELKMQFIYPKIDQSAKLFLIEAVKGGKGDPVVLKPIFIHEEGKRYTSFIEDILNQPKHKL